jgi:hypothetical protein
MEEADLVPEADLHRQVARRIRTMSKTKKVSAEVETVTNRVNGGGPTIDEVWDHTPTVERDRFVRAHLLAVWDAVERVTR